MIQTTSTPIVLIQYNKMRGEVFAKMNEIQVQSVLLNERLNGLGKKAFENNAKEMIEGLKKTNLDKLKPALKEQIEEKKKDTAIDTERKRNVKIVAVALLVIGGIAASILAMQALVVATAIVSVAGGALVGANLLFIGFAAPFASTTFMAACALTFSLKGAVIAGICAATASIGRWAGIYLEGGLNLEEETKKSNVEYKLNKKVTKINQDVIKMTKNAIEGDQNWECQFNALIEQGVFTEDNLKAFKEFLVYRPVNE